MTRYETPWSHGCSGAWLQPGCGQSQERLEKGKCWLLTFGFILCWSKTSDVGGVGKNEHEETTEQSESSGYHTLLTRTGELGSCFLHLSINVKIMPNAYPKIYVCLVLHRDKVVSPQSTPLRSANLWSLSKTLWWVGCRAGFQQLWTHKWVSLMLGTLWAFSLTSLSSQLLSAKWSTEDFLMAAMRIKALTPTQYCNIQHN